MPRRAGSVTSPEKIAARGETFRERAARRGMIRYYYDKYIREHGTLELPAGLTFETLQELLMLTRSSKNVTINNYDKNNAVILGKALNFSIEEIENEPITEIDSHMDYTGYTVDSHNGYRLGDNECPHHFNQVYMWYVHHGPSPKFRRTLPDLEKAKEIWIMSQTGALFACENGQYHNSFLELLKNQNRKVHFRVLLNSLAMEPTLDQHFFAPTVLPNFKETLTEWETLQTSYGENLEVRLFDSFLTHRCYIAFYPKERITVSNKYYIYGKEIGKDATPQLYSNESDNQSVKVFLDEFKYIWERSVPILEAKITSYIKANCPELRPEQYTGVCDLFNKLINDNKMIAYATDFSKDEMSQCDTLKNGLESEALGIEVLKAKLRSLYPSDTDEETEFKASKLYDQLRKSLANVVYDTIQKRKNKHDQIPETPPKG